MNKTRFKWSVSVCPVMLAYAVVFTACILQSPLNAAPPRGYFTNTTYVGPLSGVDAHHFMPTVSRDGLTLYFNDSDYGPQIDGVGSNDIFVAHRSDLTEPFGNVVKLGPLVNTNASELMGSISEDGLSLYFSRSSDTVNFSGHDMFVATRISDLEPFSSVVSLGPGVNTEAGESPPRVSLDAHTLVYSAWEGNLTNPSTDVDVWMATRESTTKAFGNAHRLSMNTTTVSDYFPSLSSDGLALFTSDFAFQGLRPGSDGEFRLWVSTRQRVDDNFDLPIRVDEMWPDSEITWHNSNGPNISPDWPAPGSKLYWSAQRPGTTPNSLDIYQADWIPYLDGDFNIDGRCDGLDFLLWQRDPSVGLLSDWEANYGRVAGRLTVAPSDTSQGVPEPGTLLLACVGLAVAGLYGRARNNSKGRTCRCTRSIT